MLLSGTVATLARDIPASAAFYASYELIQRRLAPDGDRYMALREIPVQH